MLKIEGDDVSAIEVAHEINELKATLKQRKEDNLLCPPAAIEREMLIECGYNVDELTAVCHEFYGNLIQINYKTLLVCTYN